MLHISFERLVIVRIREIAFVRIAVFICGVLCVHFLWAYQSPRKKYRRGAAFSCTGEAFETGECARENEHEKVDDCRSCSLRAMFVCGRIGKEIFLLQKLRNEIHIGPESCGLALPAASVREGKP